MADIKLLKQEIKLLAELKKHRGSLNDNQREELNLLREQLKTMLSINKTSIFNKRTQKDIVSLSAQITNSILSDTKSSKIMGDYAKEQLNIEEKILNNVRNIGKASYEQLDISDMEERFAKEKLDIQSKYFGANENLGRVIISNLETRMKYEKSIIDIQDEAHDRVFEANAEFRETFHVDRIKKWGNALKSPQGRMALMKLSAAGIVLSILAWGKGMIDFVKEQGLAYSQMKDIGFSIAFAQDEAAALLEHFGTTDAITIKTTAHMKLLSKLYNVSADSTAQLMKVMEGTSDATKSQLVNQIKVNSALAAAEGVAPGKVMEDIAANTELFAMFAKDGGDNIFRAAIAARKLGLELSEIESITSSLLDFETSIENEMMAEVLIGRELNLERARQLAFMGDQEGALKAIVSELGSEAEFNRLNVIARQALAEAVGLTVAQTQRAIATSPQAAVGVGGNKELVSLTKQMLEQNKMLMGKLDRSVKQLGAI